MTSFIKVGAWRQTRRILAAGPVRARAAFDVVVLQEALFFERKAKEGIRSQAPGGRRFKPLSPNTLKIRRFLGFRGTKALLVRGDLRNSIKAVPVARGVAFVGVLRGARGSGGQDLVNVAAVHEFGAGPIIIRVTPKMRRFLAAAGVFEGDGSSPAGGGGGGGGLGIIVVRIPARSFLGPIRDRFFVGPAARRRVLWRVAIALRRDFGTPGGSPPSG